jgi:hypothetical protein
VVLDGKHRLERIGSRSNVLSAPPFRRAYLSNFRGRLFFFPAGNTGSQHLIHKQKVRGAIPTSKLKYLSSFHYLITEKEICQAYVTGF